MYCAVAVLETPNSFVMEGAKPAPAPGNIYPELRFWGGKVDPDINPLEAEFAELALMRELEEELRLRVQITAEDHVWTGHCQNQTRGRRVMTPLFALFHVEIGSIDELHVDLLLQSRLVEVRKDRFESDRRLTHFAREGLRKFVDPSYTIKRTIEQRAA